MQHLITGGFALIRLGYACISLATKNNPNKKTTLKQLEGLEPPARLKKLRKVLQTNFFNLMDLLAYNVEHAIYVYRLPSEFVPLATHPIAQDWDWAKEFRWDFERAGEYILKNGIRLTSHPGHYSILNTNNPDVLAATIADFDYHARVFDLMGLDENSVMVTHVGGVYGDKPSSLARFREHYANLPAHIKKRLVVENDDTSFTMREVLELCESIGAPMVLDIHHHQILNCGENWLDFLPRILTTWGARTPKMHFSSPKSEKDFRAHANEIDLGEFISFVGELTEHNVDIILECKNKDTALHNLRKGLTERGVHIETLPIHS